ncbi:unnamed protein product, partial [Rotaria sp. Silwood1]
MTTDSKFSNSEDEEISWFNWVRTLGKMNLQETQGDVSTLLDTIDEQWSVLLFHHFVKNQQKLYIDRIKKASSEKDYIVITCDFAGNYTLAAQREIQSAHWSKQQASLFTIHIKIGESHINLAIISNYLNHDTAFVYYCQQQIIGFIKARYPLVKRIVYVSDGATMHFKNKFNMVNLSFHKNDFDLEAEWLFTATSHGKSACD